MWIGYARKTYCGEETLIKLLHKNVLMINSSFFNNFSENMISLSLTHQNRPLQPYEEGQAKIFFLVLKTGIHVTFNGLNYVF